MADALSIANRQLEAIETDLSEEVRRADEDDEDFEDEIVPAT